MLHTPRCQDDINETGDPAGGSSVSFVHTAIISVELYESRNPGLYAYSAADTAAVDKVDTAAAD